jgi:hypothetical protein
VACNPNNKAPACPFGTKVCERHAGHYGMGPCICWSCRGPLRRPLQYDKQK